VRRGVIIRTVINSIMFGGATKEVMQCAVRDELIAFMAATAQAHAEATKEAQRAGIAHAKANGDALTYKGRKPSYSRKQFETAQAMLRKSSSIGEVASGPYSPDCLQRTLAHHLRGPCQQLISRSTEAAISPWLRPVPAGPVYGACGRHDGRRSRGPSAWPFARLPCQHARRRSRARRERSPAPYSAAADSSR
jgi:hypothetical protein